MHKRIEARPTYSQYLDTYMLINDFLEYTIRVGGMSETELANQAMVMLTAGAETSAIALTASLWYLSQPEHAHCLDRLRQEVRSTFRNPIKVTGDATARLPYLNAVLEGFLLLPVGPPRVSPLGGETVDGTFVPGGVYMSADVWSIHHDARTVGDHPDTFKPERWCDSLAKP